MDFAASGFVSPFSTQYCLQEVDFYGLRSHYYEDSGLEVRIKALNAKDNLHDFLNEHPRQSLPPVPTLYREHWQWMSLKPAEIQSMWVPIRQATGRVATAGLGLGYYALRVAAKPEVESVDVYEIDYRVIDFFTQQFSHREEFSKIHIVPGDVRQTLIDRTYDFCFLDFYGVPFPSCYLEDLKQVISRNQIGQCRMWYQERILQQLWMDGAEIALDPDEMAFFLLWQEYRKTGNYPLKPRLPQVLVEGYHQLRRRETVDLSRF